MSKTQKVVRVPSRGRPPKTNLHQLFSLRLPVDLHTELRIHAIENRTSLNDILLGVIQEWWKKTKSSR